MLGRTSAPAPLSRTELISYVNRQAPQLGLDPQAVLAVAAQEGLGGGVGDQGTSFGPWQLHKGGTLPTTIGRQGADAAQAWAWSEAGVDYALNQMAEAGAAGQSGNDAITTIVSKFERPKNPQAEIDAAEGAYGTGGGVGTITPGGVPKPYVPPSPIGSNPRPGVSSGGSGSDFWDDVEGAGGSVLGAVEAAGGSLFGAVQGTAEGLVTNTLGFLKAALWLLNPLTWLRLVEAVAGGVMIAAGVAVLTGAASAFARVAAARAGVPLGAAPAGAALGAAATRGAETRRAVRTGERQAELAQARTAGRQGRRSELKRARRSAQDDRSPLFGG